MLAMILAFVVSLNGYWVLKKKKKMVKKGKKKTDFDSFQVKDCFCVFWLIATASLFVKMLVISGEGVDNNTDVGFGFSYDFFSCLLLNGMETEDA